MVKRLLALVAMALLAMPAFSKPYEESTQSLMTFTCKALKVDCSNLQPPEIAIVPLPPGMAGGYGTKNPEDDNTIFISIEFALTSPHKYLYSVVVHEMTHYVDFKLGLARDPCESEDHAWAVSNRYLRAHNKYEWVDQHWKWRYTDECSR